MAEYLTKDGLNKLKEELNYLEKTERKNVSEKLKQAISEGDLSENAGYEDAKEKQNFIEKRIKELKEIIAQTVIIEKKESDKVRIGSFVFLETNESREKFQIVGSAEADVLKGKISYESPLGKAILNKKKGEVIKISTPDGQKEYKIIEIE